MRAGEIYLPYQSAPVEGEIADGCKVIEFGKPVPGDLKLLPAPEQFLVLQLQFDLLTFKKLLDPDQLLVLHLQLDLLSLQLLLGP